MSYDANANTATAETAEMSTTTTQTRNTSRTYQKNINVAAKAHTTAALACLSLSAISLPA
jgi:hypothetical protein